MQPRDSRVLVHVGQHVAEDQDAIRLPPERDVSLGVPGDVEHLESGDLVSLLDRAVDLATGAVEDPPEEVGHELVGLALVDQLGVLGRGHVQLGAPEWNSEFLADVAAGALMVRVRVSERVDPHLVSVELLQDPPGRLPAPRVDQDIAGEVGVDRPGQAGEALEVPDAVGELLHQ